MLLKTFNKNYNIFSREFNEFLMMKGETASILLINLENLNYHLT